MSNLEIGIIGLPNVGKTTLFNAITKANAEAANYPFCTIEPNIGVVAVPDMRLEVLTKLFNSKKTTPASVQFVDIAGLVEGASKGEGLGNKFLENIRQVDAIAHVVRCFEDEDITHVSRTVDSKKDIETIQTELCLADLEIVERKLEKLLKLSKAGNKIAKIETDILERIKDSLENAKSARNLNLNEEELSVICDINLLTLKPMLYVANISEDKILETESIPQVKNVLKIAANEKAPVMTICAKIESELAELDSLEAEEFLSELGLESSGLDRLIKVGFDLLGLMTFLTAGSDECRAWTIKKGTTAIKAAGKIHSDIERGFIRAEIVNYDDLVRFGSINIAREHGLVRLEGKDYIMQDGDVTHFRFNV